jgi:hypothetical protein
MGNHAYLGKMHAQLGGKGSNCSVYLQEGKWNWAITCMSLYAPPNRFLLHMPTNKQHHMFILYTHTSIIIGGQLSQVWCSKPWAN